MSKSVEINEGQSVSVDSMAGDEYFTEKKEPPRTIKPLIMDKSYDDEDIMYDFRPQAVEADRPDADPKDSSAAEPADSSSSETAKANGSQLELDLTVPVAKVNMKRKA